MHSPPLLFPCTSHMLIPPYSLHCQFSGKSNWNVRPTKIESKLAYSPWRISWRGVLSHAFDTEVVIMSALTVQWPHLCLGWIVERWSFRSHEMGKWSHAEPIWWTEELRLREHSSRAVHTALSSDSWHSFLPSGLSLSAAAPAYLATSMATWTQEVSGLSPLSALTSLNAW